MDTIRIGTIYNLNDKYNSNYTHSIITYDVKAQETVVELFSNWNSLYNKVERFRHLEPLEVVAKYLA